MIGKDFSNGVTYKELPESKEYRYTAKTFKKDERQRQTVWSSTFSVYSGMYLC
jgi:hypothetical protein